jgi:hypothetical protein
VWRVLRPGGHLMLAETPNKYFPKEGHTTGLWFNHWLPREFAHRRAVRRGRFDPNRTDWESSGWRGLGYFELVKPISGYRLIPERTRHRHRLLSMLGIPPSLIDPGPIWVLQKLAGSPSGQAESDRELGESVLMSHAHHRPQHALRKLLRWPGRRHLQRRPARH